mmetsp:Transcript_29385/g.63734  ORF Transcript_29385/g.63734 Transcript_29385/m.63734 type:complete len:121 (-) Transcript_29385:1057-1419(-)
MRARGCKSCTLARSPINSNNEREESEGICERFRQGIGRHMNMVGTTELRANLLVNEAAALSRLKIDRLDTASSTEIHTSHRRAGVCCLAHCGSRVFRPPPQPLHSVRAPGQQRCLPPLGR